MLHRTLHYLNKLTSVLKQPIVPIVVNHNGLGVQVFCVVLYLCSAESLLHIILRDRKISSQNLVILMLLLLSRFLCHHENFFSSELWTFQAWYKDFSLKETWLTDNSPTDISATYISPMGHFSHRYFADRHFADGHLADNPDILTTIHSADKHHADRDYFDWDYTTVSHLIGLHRKINFAIIQLIRIKDVLRIKQYAHHTYHWFI